MFFDDGSSIDPRTGIANPSPDGMLPGDIADAAQMERFNPNPQAPWWQSLVQYGITRAIDNRFSQPNVTGNTNPGSFGGANGATYANGNQAVGASAKPASAGMLSGTNGLLLLGGAAVLAFLALRS